MSGLDDLGRALRDDAAANAPRASAIDVDAVARAARARRRPRLIGVGTLALVGSLGLGGLAVGALAPPALIAAGESQSSTADAPAAEGADLDGGELEAMGGGESPARIDDPLRCGAAAPAEPTTDDRVRLALDLPASVPSGRPQTGDEPVGSLRLINAGPEALTVESRPEAFAVLLQNGVVVGQPGLVGDAGLMAVLDPGASLELLVRLLTVSCLDGSALPPGDYAVLVSADVGIDGEQPMRLTASPVTVRID